MIYLVFRELLMGNGASLRILVGDATTDRQKAEELACLMNENKYLHESAKVLDCKVLHRVVEVRLEGTSEANRRGDISEPLGGLAGVGGSNFKYLICGNCTPEPLHQETMVLFKVRKIGVQVASGVAGQMIGVDVLECPKCGHQVLR